MISLSSVRQRYSERENPLKTQRRVELGVIILLGLLCLQLLWGAVRLFSLEPPASVTPAPDTLQVLPMKAMASVSIDDSNEMRSRPLFWQSRRPLVEVEALVETESAAKGKATPKELKQIKLLGVFGSEEATGIIAMVKGKKQRLMAGQDYQGWTLESVDANEVTFTDGPRSETLTLKKAVIEAPPPVSPAVDENKAAAQAASTTDSSVATPAGAGSDDGKEPAAPRGLSLGGP